MSIARFRSLSFILRPGKVSLAQYNGLRSCNCTGISSLLKQNDNNRGQTCLASTYEVKTIQKEESLIRKVLNKIPFLNVKKTRIIASAYILYEGIADKINYVAFFEEFDLPDTFYSWFVITELHIWMLSVRAMADGTDGRYLRNGLVEVLWADVAQRVKKLGVGSISSMKGQISELSEQLQAAFLAYDEGLQSSDIILAGALWRRFYQSERADPEHLEELVKYVRRQISLLDNVSSHQLFIEKSVNWATFKK